MNKNECLVRYIEFYHERLKGNDKVLKQLDKLGINEPFIVENFQLGYADGSLLELVKDNSELSGTLTELGILKDGKEKHTSCLIVTVFGDAGVIDNIAFCKLTGKMSFAMLNNQGVFNWQQVSTARAIVVCDDPVTSLRLIAQDIAHATFYSGNLDVFVTFSSKKHIQRVVFTMDGHASLFASLVQLNIDCERVPLEFESDGTINIDAREKLTLGAVERIEANSVEEIERGLLFRFDPLSYRVIGDFKEQSLTLKVNMKAFTTKDVFLDSIDLYRNRDRQHFICNLMDTFNIRDQEFLQADLNRIIAGIEQYQERMKKEDANKKPAMSDEEKEIALRFLQNPDLIDELTADIDRLGYVRERKNKILLYLVMTSRLMDDPLHALIVSRSGAGKSQLVEIVESLCPDDEAVVMSDLSDQALYYMGADSLRHRFVVISEREGSKGSEYPLRELISKKSITKAVPVKDHTSGMMKTTNITVNGPISLVETTTSGDINPENLNRCFVIGIDESEEQTEAIQECQRLDDTLEGFLGRANLDSNIAKHHVAQRLLRHIKVFNPFAPLLTFPKSRLAMRRDHDKFLKLIKVVCFLKQYQREVKSVTLANDEIVEYIECTVDDYRLAYDLLADGILDYTLDDLPRPARELFKFVKAYLESTTQGPLDNIQFTRKDIRDFSGWSFAQVRNNMMKLKEYEYVKVARSKAGTAEQYTLNGSYEGLDYQNTILTPEQLLERIEAQGKITKKKVVVKS